MRLCVNQVSFSHFSGMCLDRVDFSGSKLNNVDFEFTRFRRANFRGASLVSASLTNSNFFKADLSNAILTHAYLENTRFVGANFSGADLTFCDLTCSKLIGADLSNADLTDASLSGADLTWANLSGAIGLGTRSGEIEFAKWLLNVLQNRKGALEMQVWHTCETTHCLAGWALPNVEYPAPKASRMYPTLAKFFYTTNEKALEALELVAAGKLSVFPD